MLNNYIPNKAQNYQQVWFLNLRRFAFITQISILLWARYVENFELPFKSLLLCILCIPLLELLARYGDKILSQNTIQIALLFLDSLILTTCLYLSGGPNNPLSILYFLQVVLCAVLLNSTWTWIMAAFTSFCFAALFFKHIPIKALEHAGHHGHHTGGLALHLKGMLYAFIIVSALAAYFLNKILAEKKSVEDEVLLLKSNQKKLAAMTALASEAAHNLGTPLSSISIITDELLNKYSNAEFRNDLLVLDKENQRCKNIIDDLCLSAGTVTGCSIEKISPEKLFSQTCEDVNLDSSQFTINDETKAEFLLPSKAIIKALKCLIENAAAAQKVVGAEFPLVLRASKNNNNLYLEIEDQGPGISKNDLLKIRDPFFTTKNNAANLGLGVYIADLIAKSLSGELSYFSTTNMGTKARLSIPV